MITLPITPVPKPRMTQRDRWAKRASVLRYFAYCDELRLLTQLWKYTPSDTLDITFYFPIPYSWNPIKKEALAGQPHTQKPDLDNLVKAFLDALHTDDSHVWKIKATKRWAVSGRIELQ